jgi:DNA-directed RNA polymerase specialized sigma24 family protein
MEGPRGNEVFPPTPREWLASQSLSGRTGRRLANAFVMELYAPALEAYLRGSRWRSAGEPRDLVHGYFASRLSREDFFERWLASGLRFRRWLVNGMLFHLREATRGRRPITIADDEAALAPEPDAVERFEQEWARGIVRAACERASAECMVAGRWVHWRLFIRHTVDGVPYSKLAAELGIQPERAPGLARTAAHALRRAIHELLIQEGVPPGEVAAETDRLLTALAT